MNNVGMEYKRDFNLQARVNLTTVNAHTRLVLQLYHGIIYQISTQNIPHKISLHLEKNRLLQQGTKVEREECKPTILYVLHHIIIVAIENERCKKRMQPNNLRGWSFTF